MSDASDPLSSGAIFRVRNLALLRSPSPRARPGFPSASKSLARRPAWIGSVPEQAAPGEKENVQGKSSITHTLPIQSAEEGVACAVVATSVAGAAPASGARDAPRAERRDRSSSSSGGGDGDDDVQRARHDDDSRVTSTAPQRCSPEVSQNTHGACDRDIRERSFAFPDTHRTGERACAHVEDEKTEAPLEALDRSPSGGSQGSAGSSTSRRRKSRTPKHWQAISSSTPAASADTEVSIAGVPREDISQAVQVGAGCGAAMTGTSSRRTTEVLNTPTASYLDLAEAVKERQEREMAATRAGTPVSASASASRELPPASVSQYRVDPIADESSTPPAMASDDPGCTLEGTHAPANTVDDVHGDAVARTSTTANAQDPTPLADPADASGGREPSTGERARPVTPTPSPPRTRRSLRQREPAANDAATGAKDEPSSDEIRARPDRARRPSRAESSVTREKKRCLSPDATEDDTIGIVRRSGRAVRKPLDFWRNEVRICDSTGNVTQVLRGTAELLHGPGATSPEEVREQRRRSPAASSLQSSKGNARPATSSRGTKSRKKARGEDGAVGGAKRGGRDRRSAKRAATSKRKRSDQEESSPGSTATASSSADAVPAQESDVWTPARVRELHRAVSRADASSAQLWDIVAQAVGGGVTADQCRARWMQADTTQSDGSTEASQEESPSRRRTVAEKALREADKEHVDHIFTPRAASTPAAAGSSSRVTRARSRLPTDDADTPSPRLKLARRLDRAAAPSPMLSPGLSPGILRQKRRSARSAAYARRTKLSRPSGLRKNNSSGPQQSKITAWASPGSIRRSVEEEHGVCVEDLGVRDEDSCSESAEEN